MYPKTNGLISLAGLFLLAAFSANAQQQGRPANAGPQIISTCDMPVELRSAGIPPQMRPSVQLIRQGERFDVVLNQGPYGAWLLSDGGSVDESGSPENEMRLQQGQSRFVFTRQSGNKGVLTWQGADGKTGTSPCWYNAGSTGPT